MYPILYVQPKTTIPTSGSKESLLSVKSTKMYEYKRKIPVVLNLETLKKKKSLIKKKDVRHDGQNRLTPGFVA